MKRRQKNKGLPKGDMCIEMALAAPENNKSKTKNEPIDQGARASP
jgi:hypothetical protein